jgi:hypothetical protein
MNNEKPCAKECNNIVDKIHKKTPLSGTERYTMTICKKEAKGEDIFKPKKQNYTSFLGGVADVAKRIYDTVTKGEILIGKQPKVKTQNGTKCYLAPFEKNLKMPLKFKRWSNSTKKVCHKKAGKSYSVLGVVYHRATVKKCRNVTVAHKIYHPPHKISIKVNNESLMCIDALCKKSKAKKIIIIHKKKPVVKKHKKIIIVHKKKPVIKKVKSHKVFVQVNKNGKPLVIKKNNTKVQQPK